jgi:hypothetical protein
MNINWDDSYESELPRGVLHADGDGVMHLNANLLAEFFQADSGAYADDDFEIVPTLRTRSHIVSR